MGGRVGGQVGGSGQGLGFRVIHHEQKGEGRGIGGRYVLASYNEEGLEGFFSLECIKLNLVRKVLNH